MAASAEAAEAVPDETEQMVQAFDEDLQRLEADMKAQEAKAKAKLEAKKAAKVKEPT